MKPSLAELIALSQRFYPKQFDPGDPRYKTTDEFRRLLEVQEKSAAEVGGFREMLDRLRARFPNCSIDDRLYAIPSLMTAWDVCYPAKLVLSTIPKDDGEHALALLISNIAPYYMIHRVRFLYDPTQKGSTSPMGDRDCTTDRSPENFLFSPEEAPYVSGIAEEIEATYGYERLLPEVGNQFVPDVRRNLCGRREATLFDCLFTDQIW